MGTKQLKLGQLDALVCKSRRLRARVVVEVPPYRLDRVEAGASGSQIVDVVEEFRHCSAVNLTTARQGCERNGCSDIWKQWKQSRKLSVSKFEVKFHGRDISDGHINKAARFKPPRTSNLAASVVLMSFGEDAPVRQGRESTILARAPTRPFPLRCTSNACVSIYCGMTAFFSGPRDLAQVARISL